MDEKGEAMQFDRVAHEARRQNGWKVEGIVEAEESEGTYPGGVVVFDRPNVRRDDPEAVSVSYGTAAFVIAELGKISFHHGHYDMSHDEALADFAERAPKGR